MSPAPRRGLRVVGWLLTPAVVWAAAFFGAWAGAALGGRLVWLLGGAMVGGVVGIVLWGVLAALHRRPRVSGHGEAPGPETDDR